MRVLSIASGLAVVAGVARADRVPDRADAQVERGDDDFWREVAEPHHDEVASLLQRCRRAIVMLDESDPDNTPSSEARRALARDLVHVLRYARRLEPDNVDVLRLLAEVADDAGDARVERDALDAVVALVGEEHAGPEVLDRIGAAAIDAGRYDDAIHALRLAQVPARGAPSTPLVLVHLATALALSGHSADGIDVLADALPGGMAFEPNEVTLVGFALAVQYDRDEQRGAAFDVLDRMKAELGDALAPALQSALARMRFAPAEDERYYRALMDEVVGDVPEARTEWLLYAADEAAPYRGRALDHARALDAMPHARKAPVLPIRRIVLPSPQPQVRP